MARIILKGTKKTLVFSGARELVEGLKPGEEYIDTLFGCLKDEEALAALKRGKAYLRGAQRAEREKDAASAQSLREQKRLEKKYFNGRSY